MTSRAGAGATARRVTGWAPTWTGPKRRSPRRGGASSKRSRTRPPAEALRPRGTDGEAFLVPADLARLAAPPGHGGGRPRFHARAGRLVRGQPARRLVVPPG